MKKYWYKMTKYICGVCGQYQYRNEKRMYTPKPEKYEDRVTEEFCYCGCEDNWY